MLARIGFEARFGVEAAQLLFAPLVFAVEADGDVGEQRDDDGCEDEQRDEDEGGRSASLLERRV